MLPFHFRPINHDLVDHTWADVESIAHQERGGVLVVVRKYKRKEWSVKIVGLGCERYRIAWSCRTGGWEGMEAIIDSHVARLYPEHAKAAPVNY